MCAVVSEVLSGSHMDPPALLPYTHPGFVLVQDPCFENRCLELRFPRSKMLMTVLDKTRDASRGELDTKEIVKELTRPCIGNAPPHDQIGRLRLNTRAILCWCSDIGCVAKNRGEERELGETPILLQFHEQTPASFIKEFSNF